MNLFLSGFLLSLSLCLDLGIVNLCMIKTGVERGFRPAFLLGLGSSLGDLIYAGLSLAGITFLLQFMAVKWALWLGGSGVLLYLTYSMLRQSFQGKEVVATNNGVGKDGRPKNDLLWGIGLALASPSAILWFATVGGSIIASSGLNSGVTLLAFFGGFFLASCLWCLAVALVCNHGGKLMGPKLVRGFSLASAALFLYFAVKVFVNGYKTLL
jgi:L-lysine exporter family protein LysE/ArgO